MTQAQALTILRSGANVFLTGAAGTGKTYVLNQFISEMQAEGAKVAITASTGIAATHMGGMTIHSWAGIGIDQELDEKVWSRVGLRELRNPQISEAEILVIDEISMLHHYRLDMVDAICRRIRKSAAPFGGLQVVLAGDFFQLPPVSRRDEPAAKFAISAAVWQAMELQICYLTHQYRQDDDGYTALLNEIRDGEVSQLSIEALQSRQVDPAALATIQTQLFTTNRDVDVINQQQLAALSNPSEKFTMTTKGDRELTTKLKNGCMSPEMLELKEGAAVMFVKNNYEKGYVNGTLGTVEAFSGEQRYPVIRTFDGARIVAQPESWTIQDDDRVIAEIAQVPLRLAWAITIHKSQGMSLDGARIDLSKAFVPGMGYVALSRLRNLAGLVLLGMNATALQVYPEIQELDSYLRKASRQTEQLLQT
jgi:ATP-dependent exoDNAse (exonuclease V) alpha subunit